MLQRESIHASIYYYLIIILVFLLPLYQRAVPLVIILITLNWIVEGNYRRKFTQFPKKNIGRLILLFVLLYVFYLFSLAYSKNLDNGLFELQVKLSLFVFPILFATINRNIITQKRTLHICLAFCAGCILASVFILIAAFYRYSRTLELNEFIYTNLSILVQTTYYSMYLGFAFAIITKLLIDKWEKLTIRLKLLLILIMVYFSLIILLLCSRAGIITLILIFIIFISYSFQSRRHFIPGVILCFMTITCVLLASHFFKERFGVISEVIINIENVVSNNSESSAERILIWGSAIESCKDSPIIGHGIGDVSEELNKYYQKNHFYSGLRFNRNAHNQYLQSQLAIGLVGAIILILSIGLPLIWAIKNKQVLYVAFLVIIGSNFLFESMLCRQAGVVFYAFFNVFLLLFHEDDSVSPGP